MAKRKSIPETADPLGAILGSVEALPRAKQRVRREKKHAPAPMRIAKKRMAFDISEDVAERIRDCVIHLSGPPLHLNLSRFAETAFLNELERLRREHNAGEHFPNRAEDPRPGRPLV